MNNGISSAHDNVNVAISSDQHHKRGNSNVSDETSIFRTDTMGTINAPIVIVDDSTSSYANHYPTKHIVHASNGDENSSSSEESSAASRMLSNYN